MAYVLGLDLGTSSIGVAALSLDEHGSPVDILDHHVYIFREPLINDQGTLVSKKAGRRVARQARKQRDRRVQRLSMLAAFCTTQFVSNLTASVPIRYPDELARDIAKYQSMALRAYAATHQIALPDLTAVVLHIAKSRGYSGGFKPLSAKNAQKLADETDLDLRAKIMDGVVQPGHDRLAHIMKARNCATVGQYLLDRAKRGLPSILKASDRAVPNDRGDILAEEICIDKTRTGEVKSTSLHNLYALRDELKSEFKMIWDRQSRHYPELTPLLFEQISSKLFYQRPLKSVAPMVGGCTLEPTLPRAPKAHPAFQAFRIEKQIADLRWGFGRRAGRLDNAEAACIRKALNDPSLLDGHCELSFEKIYSLLDRQLPLPDGSKRTRNLNLSNGGREGLKGNVTHYRWHKLGLFDAWQSLTKPGLDDATDKRGRSIIDRKTWVINFLSDLGSEEMLYAQDWASQFGRLPDLKARSQFAPRRGAQRAMFQDARFVAFIDAFRGHEKFASLRALGFDSGRASYSIKALKRINDWFEQSVDLEDGRDETGAIDRLYEQSKKTETVVEFLEAPAKVGNGSVDVALAQVRKVVNRFIERHGKPARIVVEMTRDMGEGVTRRNEIQKSQNQQRGTQKLAADDMKQKGIGFSKTNVLRYRLAVDQAYQCPYCAGNFGSNEIYDGHETNLEHIVPRSITQVGRKYSEIVLAHRRCNDRKAANVPMVAFAFNTGPILSMAARLRGAKQFRKAMLLEMPETPDTKLDDVALKDFCDRQFHETAWITKLAATWLRSLGVNVECVRGSMTEQLRRQWGLATLIPAARINEGLPVYSEVSEHGEVKETIVPTTALLGVDDQPTLLWNYWDDEKLTKEQLDEVRRSGLYRYDKRCDHRHHLIDAITIALCDRSMVKAMADDYKCKSELEAQKPEALRRRVRFGRIPCPMPDLKGKAAAAVAAQRVTIRPDRRPSGAWFQETAYGLHADKGGEIAIYLINRIALRALIAKDHDTTLKNIDDVIGPEVRLALRNSYLAFCASTWAERSPEGIDKVEYEKATESLWQVAPIHPRFNRAIQKVMQKKAKYLPTKHVVIHHRNASKPTKPHSKVLIADENACIAWDPVRPQDGARVINSFSARDPSAVDRRFRVVFKGDTVLSKEGGRYLVRGLNEASNRLETMMLVVSSAKLRTTKAEGRQDFRLTPAKQKGSLSLWDIVEIIQDPFDGRPTRAAD